MSEAVVFRTFYEAVHQGRAPFPWQERLARQVAGDGWPAVVGVPTGLGKTACIDVAVWALSCSADRSPADRRAPTRTWYVVNRRLLVDAAYEHGRRLQALLRAPESLLDDWPDAEQTHVAALRSVGDRLRSIAALGSAHGPLHLTRLRGGGAPEDRVPDPSQPALLFTTVPMYASRWLFQGYGCSSSMRPVEATLAGTDSLLLLDESHLARPLRDLQAPAAQADLGDPTQVLPAARARPVLVELTATGDPGREVLDLGPDDRAHSLVARRLDAAKPTTLVEATRKTMSRGLADAAVSLLDADGPLSLVVFCNTARLAREVHARLAGPSQRAEFDLVLLTGRVRDRDGEAIRRRLLDPETGAPAGRPAGVQDRHLVVVARPWRSAPTWTSTVSSPRRPAPGPWSSGSAGSTGSANATTARVPSCATPPTTRTGRCTGRSRPRCGRCCRPTVTASTSVPAGSPTSSGNRTTRPCVSASSFRRTCGSGPRPPARRPAWHRSSPSSRPSPPTGRPSPSHGAPTCPPRPRTSQR